MCAYSGLIFLSLFVSRGKIKRPCVSLFERLFDAFDMHVSSNIFLNYFRTSCRN